MNEWLNNKLIMNHWCLCRLKLNIHVTIIDLHVNIGFSGKPAWNNMIMRQTFFHSMGNPNQIWVIRWSHEKCFLRIHLD